MPILTAADMVPSLKQQLENVLSVYCQEKLLNPDPTFTVYTGWERNWLPRPPAVVRKNGVITNPLQVDYDEGMVTFLSANQASDLITAEFYFSALSDDDLQDFLENAYFEIQSLTNLGSGPTLIPENMQGAVRAQAWCDAFHRIMAETANYHVWTLNGVTIEKDMVTRNHKMVLQAKQDQVDKMVARLRLEGLSTGNTFSTVVGIGDQTADGLR